jgi:uncharacterized short protein YbdD (DUF466 family)
MNTLARFIAAVRRWFEYLNGDAAYREYCRHWRTHHAGERTASPPTRAEFFRAEQQRRWNGVRRCC